MRCFSSVLLSACLFTGLAGLSTAATSAESPLQIRPARNLFAEQLGRSEAELDAKLDAGFRQLFQGDEQTQRLYYPVGADSAYIADVGNADVRSEGMSYGMMIAVQMNKEEEFRRLWTWVKRHMWHTEGPRKGYFAWHCRFDGTQIDPGSASDGEEWFAMALLFAAHRWGNGEGIFDYGKEAADLLSLMVHKPVEAGITPIFDARHAMVVFAPTKTASQFTDPSYHLPAFYELWAQWGPAADREFWRKAADQSRQFFRKAAHPQTGLMPEYSGFDGRPSPLPEKGDFRFDAWRVLANVALDHAWFAKDPWQILQSNRVLSFLLSQGGPACPNQFTLDGKPLSEESSLGLTAMAAVAGLAADAELAKPFVARLWQAPVPEGKWRYYDGLLYQLALLQAGGRFHVIAPQQNMRAH